ncbi:hypothetical protein D3C71_1629510 [compost metagenome]
MTLNPFCFVGTVVALGIKQNTINFSDRSPSVKSWSMSRLESSNDSPMVWPAMNVRHTTKAANWYATMMVPAVSI